MASSSDRVTPARDLSELARSSERQFAAASSDVRRVIPLSSVPWLLATQDDLVGMPLDHRAGFVLSLIDGRCTVEMILDMAGMPEDETMGILDSLRQLGIIELHEA